MSAARAVQAAAAPRPVVVVTDVEEAVRFPRALERALRAVGGRADVVGVTHRAHQLPARLQRSVRLVRVASAAGLTEAVEREARAERLVLVVCSGSALDVGCLDGASAAARAVPLQMTSAGREGHVVVVPAPVRFTGGAGAFVDRVPGVGPCRAAVPAPGPDVRAGALPRLSACLIVKDEEAVLGECLDALAGAVDEVVVYDTGSSDATVDVAHAHGAVVVQGHWDDHFGDARNRALAHATGDWVLSVDADEVLRGDVADLRRCLTDARGDLVRVPIVNTTWKGAQDGQRFQPVRLFRRTRCRWTGALHEYLVEHEGAAELVLSPRVPAVRLDHSGYQYLTFTDKDKPARNLAIARAAVDRLAESGDDPTTTWDGYGRSLLSAGHRREALDALHHVLERPTNSAAVLQSGRAALECMAALGDWADAGAWLDQMAQHGESTGNVLLWRARHAVADGRPDDAGPLLEAAALDRSLDRWGVPFAPSATAGTRAQLLRARGDAPGALEVLVSTLADEPESLHLAEVLLTAEAASADLADLVARLPEAFCRRSAQEAVVLAPPERGERWLAALRERLPREGLVLAAGGVVAARCDVPTAITWSSHVRAAGQPELCPLRALAAQPGRSTAERAVALAALVDAAPHEGTADELVELLSTRPEDEVDEVLSLLVAVAPAAVAALQARVAPVA